MAWITEKGYVRVCVPTHPLATRREMYEHRLIAAQCLARPLEDFEQVHHIDGNRRNNAPENLEVLDLITHAKISNLTGHAYRILARD